MGVENVARQGPKRVSLREPPRRAHPGSAGGSQASKPGRATTYLLGAAPRPARRAPPLPHRPRYTPRFARGADSFWFAR